MLAKRAPSACCSFIASSRLALSLPPPGRGGYPPGPPHRSAGRTQKEARSDLACEDAIDGDQLDQEREPIGGGQQAVIVGGGAGSDAVGRCRDARACSERRA